MIVEIILPESWRKHGAVQLNMPAQDAVGIGDRLNEKELVFRKNDFLVISKFKHKIIGF